MDPIMRWVAGIVVYIVLLRLLQLFLKKAEKNVTKPTKDKVRFLI